MTKVINETNYKINEAESSALADYALDQMHVSSGAGVSIIFIEPESMEDLHMRWLDLPGPTDVMSFPMDELRPGTAGHPTPPDMLGDIYICPQVVTRQAAGSGRSAAEGMLPLATRGVLHLLDYDHATNTGHEVVFALQRKLLLTFLASR